MMLRLLHLGMITVWALFLGWLLSYGRADLMHLIHPRLWWIIGLGVAVLCLFIISIVKSFSKPSQNKSSFLELPSLLVLLVPLVFFLLAKDARLSGVAAQNRFAKTDNGMYLNTSLPSEPASTPESKQLPFSQIIREPEKYENQEVEIICQSFGNEKLPENTMICYRYLITCCAADALPVFVFLTDINKQEIEYHRWIKVTGPFSLQENFERKFPTVKVDQWKYVEEPDFPWAF